MPITISNLSRSIALSGYSGISGTSGYSGYSGTSGTSGAAGPSTTINATNDTSSSTLYPVMVAANGSNQTAKVTTSKLVFDAGNGNLGIGTSSPSDKLQIEGTGTAPVASIRSTTTGSVNQAALNLFRGDSTNGFAQFGVGTTSTNTWQFGLRSGSTSWQLYDVGASTARVVVDTSGNVGIGTNAPPQKTTVWGGGTLPSAISNCQFLVGDTSGFANAGLALTAGSGNSASVYFGSNTSPTKGQIEYDNTNNYMRFLTDSGERMRITSGGNVGIGTNSPGQALTIGRTGTNAQIYVSTTTSGNPSIYLDASGVNNGQFFVDRSDAGIAKLQAGGNLVFQTNGANERMRIDTSGDVLIAGSTARDAERLTIYQAGGGWNYGLCLADNSGNNGFIGAGGGPGIYFAAGAGNPVGSLNSAGNFIDASDKAYKKDVRDIQYGLSTVLSLSPKSYRIIANNRAGVGFIAQDMEQVIPEVVSGEEGTKGIAYGQLTAVLVKAIQELKAEFDAYKATHP